MRYQDQTNIACVIIDGEQVDVLCADCAHRIYDGVEGAEIEIRYTFENNETDAPSHCEQCDTLLEWDMTDDGLEYIATEIREHLGKYGYLSDTLTEWHNAYGEYVKEYLTREYPDVDLDAYLDPDTVLTDYMGALLWTGTLYYMTGTYEFGGEPLVTGSLDEVIGSIYELDREVWDHSRETVKEFLEQVEPYLFYFLPVLDGSTYAPAGLMGHDYSLTRNHHGAGFWDRGIGELGEWLTHVAQNMGEHSLYGTVLLLDPRSDSLDQSNLDLESVRVWESN